MFLLGVEQRKHQGHCSDVRVWKAADGGEQERIKAGAYSSSLASGSLTERAAQHPSRELPPLRAPDILLARVVFISLITRCLSVYLRDGVMSYRRKGVRSTSKNFLVALEEGALPVWGCSLWLCCFHHGAPGVCFSLKDVDKLERIQGKDNKNDVWLGEEENNSL